MFSETEWIWIIGCVTVMVLVSILSLTPIWLRVVKFLGGPDPDYPRPAMKASEYVVFEDRALFIKGLFGGRGGPFIVTNERIIWYEDHAHTWPFNRYSGEFNLSEIVSVDKGMILALVFGGRRLWLRLRSGKGKAFWVVKLNEAIRTIRAERLTREC